MLRLNLADQNLKILLLIVLVIMGIAAGIFISIHGFSPLIAAAPFALVFFLLTINKPWIALFLFFLLVPLENLYVLEGSYHATSTKLVGGYLVFLVLITGNFRYLPEIFKNKKALWIIGFMLASVISILFSDIQSLLFGNLIRLLILLSLYFVLILMIRDITTLKYCFIALILGGVLSVLSPIVLGFGRVGGSSLERYGGLWGDQNVFAAILLTILPLSLVFFLKERKRLYKIIFAAVFLIILGGFFLTYSRGGFIAFLFLAIITLYKVLKNKHRTKILLVAIPLMIAMSAVFYNTVADNYISRVESLRALQKNSPEITESSLNKRYIYYFKIAPKLFSENPIFGTGIGGFRHYNTYYDQNSHNTYLEILTGTGIIGFIPFMMILYLSWRELKKVQYASRHIKDLSLLYYYSTALELGFLALLITGLFIVLDFNKILWLSVVFSSVMINILRNYTKAQTHAGSY